MSFLQRLYGPPNVEKLRANDDINGLIKALDYEKDYKVRLDAMRALGDLRDYLSTDVMVRRTTGKKDPYYGPIAEALRTKLFDNHTLVRQAAADALGQINDRNAIQLLITILQWQKDSDNDLRRAVARALGCLRGPEAFWALFAAIQDKDSGVSSAAKEALKKYGQAATEALVKALEHEDPHVRFVAADLLGELGDRQAIPALVPLLEGESVGLRSNAAWSLKSLGWTPRLDRAGAIFYVETHQYEKCLEIGGPAVEQLLARTKEGSRDHRLRAMEVLGGIGDPCAADAMISILMNEVDIRLRNAAVDVLIRLGSPAAESLLEALNISSYTYVKKNIRVVIEVLDGIGWEPSKTEAGAIYYVAKGEWEQCAFIGEPAVEVLIEAHKLSLLPDTSLDWSTAAGTARVLGTIGDERAVPYLIKTLKKGKAEYKNVEGSYWDSYAIYMSDDSPGHSHWHQELAQAELRHEQFEDRKKLELARIGGTIAACLEALEAISGIDTVRDKEAWEKWLGTAPNAVE